MYYVIVAICALVMLFIMFEINFYNKFQLLLIKIHESLNNIDILFEKKYNLLERSVNIIKESDKIKLEWPLIELNEEIGIDNINEYIEVIDEIINQEQNMGVLKRLKFDIFLLKERIIKQEKN